MIKKITWLLVIFSTIITNAQSDLFYDNYEWDATIFENFDKEKYKDKEIVVLKDKQVNEFAFTNDNQFVEYKLVHNVYWLNSNDKIENYNKVYLPISSKDQLLKNKARVITSNGKEIEIDDSKILESNDNKTQVSYKYYALEGVDKGSFIEYYYVIQQHPEYTGRSHALQDSNFKENVEFDIYAPNNLIIATKSYNGLSEMVKDTSATTKNHWAIRVQNLKGMDSEEMSVTNPNFQKVVYKLDKNLSNPNKEIVSYGLIAQNLYNNLHTEVDKKSNKKLKGIISDLKLEDDDLESKIRKVESYIKSNILFNKYYQSNSIAAVIDAKIANETDLLKLYIAFLKKINAKNEIVLTCSRGQSEFDKEFESYHFLNDYLFYFPEIDLYLQPLGYETRLGFPNGYLTDTYGLFIKELNLGGFTSGLGKVKYIEPVNYDKSSYDLIMNMKFSEDNMSKLSIDMLRTMKGYYSVGMESFLPLMKEEQKDEMKESLIKSVSENVTILDSEMKYSTPEEIGKYPLVIKAKLESEDFVQNAGNKYLLKLGELIGPQTEMYQEKKRTLPVSSEYERSYKNELIIEIPEGYSFKNLEDININESFSEEGEVLFSFKSGYTIEGKILKVSIKELYNRNRVKLENFESFRTVINSAANFNKIVLVLTKE